LCDRLEAEQAEREAKHAHLARAALARFAEAPTSANLSVVFHDAYTIDPADLRKLILTLAVQGKLVPQDEKDLQALSAATGVSEVGEEEDVPFAIPSRWCWARVEDVADSRLGKMLDGEKNRGEPHPYLRNTNVHWFRFELDSVKTMLLSQSELDDFRLQRGDILICEGGHGIARSAVWEEQLPGMMFQKALHRVRPFACLDPYYFTFCLRVYEADGILQRYYTGAGIPHFTGRSLAKVIFPLPPVAEQRRIVAKVDALMALVDRLEAQLAESRTAGERLMEAVVADLTTSQRAAPARSHEAKRTVEVKPDPGDPRVANARRSRATSSSGGAASRTLGGPSWRRRTTSPSTSAACRSAGERSAGSKARWITSFSRRPSGGPASSAASTPAIPETTSG
jgi:type I restriction enzyme, S subunit